MTTPLSPTLTRGVLDYLGVQAAPPTHTFVDTLLAAYIRAVPWESAFRIAKRARSATTADCPRWPEEFWHDALTSGGGGTCFESNYAFFSLLLSLGYEGYLTINNMNDYVGCHTAIVLQIEGQRYLIDAGMPLFMSILIDPQKETRGNSDLLNYTLRPDGYQRYQIDRSPHPKSYCFTLIDDPVNDSDYRIATTADYGEKGLFLDVVIVNKIVNDQQWRFSSGEQPYRLEVFSGGKRIDHPIEGDVAEVIGEYFSMDKTVLKAAFAALAP